MNESQPATTFSMILAHVIAQRCELQGMALADLYEQTGISQPSWSRLSRGQTRFDIEHLRNVELALVFPIEEMLTAARAVEAKARGEGIQLIEPYTTGNKADLAKLGVIIVAGAVLGFMAMQALKK